MSQVLQAIYYQTGFRRPPKLPYHQEEQAEEEAHDRSQIFLCPATIARTIVNHTASTGVSAHCLQWASHYIARQ